MYHDWFTANTSGAVYPGLHITWILLSCSTSEVKGIIDAIGPYDPVRRAGEWVLFFRPATSFYADESEALGYMVPIGVVNAEIDKRALLIGLDIRDRQVG